MFINFLIADDQCAPRLFGTNLGLTPIAAECEKGQGSCVAGVLFSVSD
jgi:hypothetical protein